MTNLSVLDSRKPKAIAFIDYEYWYYSYKNACQLSPDLKLWYNDMADRFDLIDIYAFGAFAQPDLKMEIPHLRTITNMIISTDNETTNHRKDVTDFIMLDAIYQKAFEHNCDPGMTYIIFTGDGHFQSVVRHLKMKLHRDVVLCGIRDTISRQLSEAASHVIEYNCDEDEVFRVCYELIIENFRYLDRNSHRKILPTFTNTRTNISQRSGIDPEIIRVALNNLIKQGYLSRAEQILDNGDQITILVPDWEKLYTSGIAAAG